MLNEKSIYKSWKKRFSYPVSSIESQAESFLKKIKKIKPVSEQSLWKKIKQHRLVVFGDDATSIRHKEMIQSLMRSRSGKSLWITNRSNAQIASLKKVMQKSSMQIRRVQAKNTHEENILILKLLKANASRFDCVFVWTGHLRVCTFRFQKMFQAYDALFVSLQTNQLRWNFPKSKKWVAVSNNFVSNLDTSALVTVDEFRAKDEKNTVWIEPGSTKKAFQQMTALLAKLLGQKKYSRPDQIFAILDRGEIQKLQKTKLSRAVSSFVFERVMRGESAVLPEQKMVLLSTSIASYIAEEAAHYLRTAHRSKVEYGRDAIVVEEALAFFASLLLFPTRPIPAKNKKTLWDKVHLEGYELGYKLWKLWNQSVGFRVLIKKIWNTYPTTDSEFEIMLSVMRDLK